MTDDGGARVWDISLFLTQQKRKKIPHPSSFISTGGWQHHLTAGQFPVWGSHVLIMSFLWALQPPPTFWRQAG